MHPNPLYQVIGNPIFQLQLCVHQKNPWVLTHGGFLTWGFSFQFWMIWGYSHDLGNLHLNLPICSTMHRRIRGVLQGERHRHAAVVADLPQRRAQRGRKLRGQTQHLRRWHRQNHQVGLAVDLGIYRHPKIWRFHLERLRNRWDFQIETWNV